MLRRKGVIMMSNKLKRFIHRRQDKRDLDSFMRIVKGTLQIVKNIESMLRDAHYDVPDFDELMIMLNNQLHDYMRVYVNHRFTKPSEILSGTDIIAKCENIHCSIIAYRDVRRAFIKSLPPPLNECEDIPYLPPEMNQEVMKVYTNVMYNHAMAICTMAHRAFILLTYDMARMEAGVDIIEEYYRSSELPKMKVSFNGSLKKEDILKQMNSSDTKSDKINNIQKGREK